MKSLRTNYAFVRLFVNIVNRRHTMEINTANMQDFLKYFRIVYSVGKYLQSTFNL